MKTKVKYLVDLVLSAAAYNRREGCVFNHDPTSLVSGNNYTMEKYVPRSALSVLHSEAEESL